MLAFAQALGTRGFSSPASCFSPTVRSREDWPQIEKQLQRVREAVGSYRGEFAELSVTSEGNNDRSYTCYGTYEARYDCGMVLFDVALQYLEGGWFIKEVKVTTPQDTCWLPVR